MSYLAILGRQPALSIAELEAVLGPENVGPIAQHALIKSLPKLERLGGTIKLAEVLAIGQSLGDELWDQALAQLPAQAGKLNLGLSCYGKRADVLRLGMALKKRLRQDGRSVRLVLPKTGQSQLSAAQLKFNKLGTIESPELVILETPGRAIIAATRQYQDIDAYAARDYARPGRSAKVGMLPPKLAQILINLAGIPLGTILDPFCGSGVILQEARLMGYAVIGADSSPAMVKATSTNMSWLEQNHPQLPNWLVAEADARSLKIWPRVSAIVTEGYLGPAFSTPPSLRELDQADHEVSNLAARFLEHLHSQVKPGFIVVMCLPAWQLANRTRLPQVVDEIPRLGYTLSQFVHTNTEELVYRRPGQIVGRKILVMKRK